MNVEAYTLDSLRKLVRELQEENRILRELLKEKNIETAAYTTIEKKNKEPDEYDPDHGARILSIPVEKDTANMFLGRFWGRKDVYAKRASKGGYFPQCANFWKAICHKKSDKRFDCEKCEHRRWKPISLEIVMQHMRGRKEDGSDTRSVAVTLMNHCLSYESRNGLVAVLRSDGMKSYYSQARKKMMFMDYYYSGLNFLEEE